MSATRLRNSLSRLVATKVQTLMDRNAEQFVRWVVNTRLNNPFCCFSETPPNKIFDLDDGSFTLNVFRKKRHLRRFTEHQTTRVTRPFAFRVRFQGRFRRALSYMRELEPSEQQNCAVALFLESTDGLLANFPEWDELRRHMEMRETPSNPFYQGVAQAILTRLTQSGLLY